MSLFRIIILWVLSLFLFACGFQFQPSQTIAPPLHIMSLDSEQPNAEMTQIMRRTLQLHHANLVKRSNQIPHLRIGRIATNNTVTSVFKQGREAEKTLSLQVNAWLFIPNKGEFPLVVNVHRSFFDDPRAALAKSLEQESILTGMYEQAALQIISKMNALYQHD